MMSEYTGRGDARRSMELLWRRVEAPTRGPKPKRSIDDIVEAAVAIADEEGLAAVSMRKVAERLGTGAMSLYTYVPSKAELLDLMFEHVIGAGPIELPYEDGWRAALQALAEEDWALYQRHPWMLGVATSRAPMGPNSLDAYEASLRTVDGIGLDGSEMIGVVGLVTGYVRGAARSVADAAEAERATGISDDDWWHARSPMLDEVWDPERFPIATRASADHQVVEQRDDDGNLRSYLHQEAYDNFRFGLAVVLDGVEALVASKRKRRQETKASSSASSPSKRKVRR